MLKQANLSFSVTAQANGNETNAIQFSTQDKKTAKLIFTIKEDKKPLNLTDIDGEITLVMQDKSRFVGKVEVTKPLDGVLEYTLTQEQIRHAGRAQGEIILKADDGSSVGGFRFNFTIKKALMDEDLGPVKEFYIQDLEAVKQDIRKKADAAASDINNLKDELETIAGTLEEEYQNKAYTVDEKLADVQATVSDLRENGTGIDAQARQKIEGVTEQLAETEKQINYKSVESFGAKGDGVTDDTLAIQQAIDSSYPLEFGKKTYLVTSVNFSNSKQYLFRDAVLLSKDIGDGVVIVSSKVHFSGRLIVNANKKMNYAIVFQNGGRSFFENIECLNANVFGLLCTSNRGGNVNISTFGQVRVSGCGRKETISVEYVNNKTIKVNKSLFRDGPGDTFSKYVFETDGVINPVVSYTEDSTNYTIVLKETISENAKVILVTGGGIMAEGSDCGVFTFQTTDIISNNGVGVRLTSLYGHSFNGLCVQGAYIGVLSGRYYRNSPVQNIVFIKPYFELISKKDFMTESSEANITVIEPIGGTTGNLFNPSSELANFLLLKRGTINTIKEYFLGFSPGARTLSDQIINTVGYVNNDIVPHTITLKKDTYSKILFITNGNQKPIKFVSAEPDYSVENGTSYTLPPNGRQIRVVAITLQTNTTGGLSQGYRIMELGEAVNYRSERNPKPKLGEQHFDTNLLKPIWCKTVSVVDGNGNVTTPAVWIDATGTVV